MLTVYWVQKHVFNQAQVPFWVHYFCIHVQTELCDKLWCCWCRQMRQPGSLWCDITPAMVLSRKDLMRKSNMLQQESMRCKPKAEHSIFTAYALLSVGLAVLWTARLAWPAKHFLKPTFVCDAACRLHLSLVLLTDLNWKVRVQGQEQLWVMFDLMLSGGSKFRNKSSRLQHSGRWLQFSW